MPGAAPFHDLTQEQLRELLLRLRLHAQWKIGAALHRDAALDPRDLALKAVADTLDGTRQFDAGQFDLLRHLTGCVDSQVGHRHASAGTRRTDRRVRPVPDPAVLAELPLDELERELERLGVDMDGDVDDLLRAVSGDTGADGPLEALGAGDLEAMPLREVERRLRGEGVDVNEWLTRAQVLIRGQRSWAPQGPRDGRSAPATTEVAGQPRRRPRRVSRIAAAGLVAACVSAIAFMVVHELGLVSRPELPESPESPLLAGAVPRVVERDIAPGQGLAEVLEEVGVNPVDALALQGLLGSGPFSGTAQLRLVLDDGRVDEAELRRGATTPIRVRRGSDGRLAVTPP